MKSGFFLAIMTIVSAAVCGPALAEKQRSPSVHDPLDQDWRRISLRSVSKTYGLGEPVLADLLVTNLGDDPVTFDLGSDDKENLGVTIKVPGGVSKTVELPGGGWKSPGTHLVGAHSTYNQRLVLNEWDDFREVGDYSVKITLIPKAGPKPDKPLTAYLHVSIGPRDKNKLGALAKTLADEALDSRDHRDRDTAVLALSYVTDPVAIPQMVRVLSSDRIPALALLWELARLGGPEAHNAIQAALGSRDLVMHYGASQVLGALRDGRALVPLPSVD